MKKSDVPSELLMGQSLRQRAHSLRIEACGAWSDVKDKNGEIDGAKCEYAAAIEARLRSAIDELADLSVDSESPGSDGENLEK